MTQQSTSTPSTRGSLLKTTRGSTGLYGCGYTACRERHETEVDALACARIRVAYVVRDMKRGDEAERLVAICRAFDAERPDVVLRCAQINAGRMVERLLEWQGTVESVGARLSRKDRQTVRRAFDLLTRAQAGDISDERDESPVAAFAAARNVFNQYLVKRSSKSKGKGARR